MHVLPDTPPGRMSGKRFHNAVFFLFLFTAVGFVAQDVSEKRRGELPQPGTSNDSYMWPAERIPPRCKCRFFFLFFSPQRLCWRDGGRRLHVCVHCPHPPTRRLTLKLRSHFFTRLCLCRAARPQRHDQTTCVQLVGRNVRAAVPRWMRNCAERGLPLRSIWLVHLVACY